MRQFIPVPADTWRRHTAWMSSMRLDAGLWIGARLARTITGLAYTSLIEAAGRGHINTWMPNSRDRLYWRPDCEAYAERRKQRQARKKPQEPVVR